MDNPRDNGDLLPLIYVDPNGSGVFLSMGKSGFVYGIDDDRVMKEYHDVESDREVELRAFARLGSHPNIVKLLGITRERSIVLERGEDLRKLLQRPDADLFPVGQRLSWAMDAAEGIRYMHQNGMLHADVGCNNMILIQDRVKIIDLEGCSIDGEQASSAYQWFNHIMPLLELTLKTDIFAYGSALYEIMTGQNPYHEYAALPDKMEIVQRLLRQNIYPDVRGIPCGEVMEDCWHGRFESMEEVIRALETDTLWTAGKNETIHVETIEVDATHVDRSEGDVSKADANQIDVIQLDAGLVN